MKRIILLSVIAGALTAAPLYARPHGGGGSRSAPAHVQRSTSTRVMNAPSNRFRAARDFDARRNFATTRNLNTSRNIQTNRNVTTARNVNRSRDFDRARNANIAQNRHRHRTRIVYVNYGYPWCGGFGWGWPYYDYYPYYSYGPSVSFNFNSDDYAYDPYMNQYGYGSNSYSNGYYSNNAQPAYRDGNYNIGNASIVSKVQEQLKRDGYYQGDVDGALGSRTKYAIRAYQRDHGLDANGTLTEELLRTMGLR